MNTPKGWRCGNGYMDDEKTIRPLQNLQEDEYWCDTHAWLEDDEGRVYDCITEDDYETMKRHDPRGLRYKLPQGLIMGETKEDLKKKGYEVIPMPMECRKLVWRKLKEVGSVCEETTALLKGIKL